MKSMRRRKQRGEEGRIKKGQSGQLWLNYWGCIYLAVQIQIARIRVFIGVTVSYILCGIITLVYFLLFCQYLMRKSTTAAKPKAVFNPKDYEKPGISLEEVLEVKEAFDLFDYEGAGVVDSNQLKNSLASFGYQAKNQTLLRVISEQSGPIDFNKFLDLLTVNVSSGNKKAVISRVFSLFDDEKTGFISIKNLRRVVKEVGENIDDAELQEMIERADLDNDGLISEEEFYAIMTRRSTKA